MDTRRLIIYPILFLITFAIASLGFQSYGLDSLVLPYAVVLGSFGLLFVIATFLKDNSIVDMFWGMGFVIGAIVSLLTTEAPTLLSYIVTGFIAFWGLRLSGRLVKRNWGKPEDFRYKAWRKEWGKNVVLIAFFRVFMVQGIINFTVGAASYIVIKYNQFDFSGVALIPVLLGLAVAFIGLAFEVIGDEQLRRHIAKGEKKLLTTGLWSITRHPNYFGEILIWFGLYATGFALIGSGVALWYYLLLIIGPLVMSLVLVKVSTPLLERHMKKYEGWDDYVATTPMLIPFTKRG
jgi:steroid 5-alpha reductase family enzyme